LAHRQQSNRFKFTVVASTGAPLVHSTHERNGDRWRVTAPKINALSIQKKRPEGAGAVVFYTVL
jgi:hypothetical protein